jgi:hypothetical protein
MTPQGEIVVAVGGLLAIVVVIYLIHKQLLTVGHGVCWVVVFLAAVVMGVWREALWFVTRMVGADFPVSAMTLLGFAVVLGILIFFSIRLSKLHMQVRLLTRYVSMLEYDLTHKGRPERS